MLVATALVLLALYLVAAVIAADRGWFAPLALVCAPLDLPTRAVAESGYRFWTVPALLFGTGAYLGDLARRHSAPTEDEARRADRRPPVLYLRSHRDDELPANVARTPAWLWWARNHDRFEQAVERTFAARGPVLALGLGVDSREATGAVKIYVPKEEWQPRVQAEMKSAGLIVWSAATTPGVWWELMEIEQGGYWSKTVIILPSPTAGRGVLRWLAVRALASIGSPAAGTPRAALVAVLRRPMSGPLPASFFTHELTKDNSSLLWWNQECERLVDALRRHGAAGGVADDELQGLLELVVARSPITSNDALAELLAALSAWSPHDVAAVSFAVDGCTAYVAEIGSVEGGLVLDRVVADRA